MAAPPRPSSQPSSKQKPPQKPAQVTKDKPESKSSRGVFLCRAKYRNTLPDVPFDCKLLDYPFDISALTTYSSSMLERTHKAHMHLTPLQVLPIDLVDPTIYSNEAMGVGTRECDPEDVKLLQETLESRKRTESGAEVNWLLKHSYLQKSEYGAGFLKRGARADQEPGIQEEEPEEEDEQKWHREVEASFAATSHRPEHPSNPSLVPVEVLDFFPARDAGFHYAHLEFAVNPFENAVQTDSQQPAATELALHGYALMRPDDLQYTMFYMPPNKRQQRKSDGAPQWRRADHGIKELTAAVNDPVDSYLLSWCGTSLSAAPSAAADGPSSSSNRVLYHPKHKHIPLRQTVMKGKSKPKTDLVTIVLPTE